MIYEQGRSSNTAIVGGKIQNALITELKRSVSPCRELKRKKKKIPLPKNRHRGMEERCLLGTRFFVLRVYTVAAHLST